MSQKTADILKQLEVGLESLSDIQTYKEYLKFMSVFSHQYSLSNMILIFTQCMQRGITPTYITGYRNFQKIHRHVSRGQKGLYVISPHFYKHKNKDGTETDEIGYHASTVFDISQTEADDERGEIPEMCHKLEGDLEDNSLLDLIISISPVPVVFKDTGEANGYYSPSAKEIAISPDLSEQQTIHTLLHEASHAWHYALVDNIDDYTREEKEAIAEASSYVVCNSSAVNISCDEYSVPYITTWSHDLKEFRRNLGLIKKISEQIISDIETKLDEIITAPAV